jgi:lipopolysaccharide transport system permease protein
LKNSALKRYVEFVWYRALAEIRADLSRGYLGFAWWVLEPVLYMGAFYLIFGLLFQQRGENYVPFLLTGLVIWKWFASSVQNSVTSISRNMTLIYQVYLPKTVFPFVALIHSTMRFAFVFAILIVFLLVTGVSPSAAWFIDLPALLLMQLALMLGTAMVCAAIAPFFPDLQFMVDNGLLLLFFLSGIFFRFDDISPALRFYFELNPIAVIIDGYRDVLIDGRHLEWQGFVLVILLSVVLLAAGVALLRRWDRLYAKKAFL